MRVNIIHPETGEQGSVEDHDLENARGMGWKSMSEIMMMSHQPGAPSGVTTTPSHTAPTPEQPSALSSIGRTINNLGSSVAHGMGTSPLMKSGMVPGLNPDALSENQKYYDQATKEQPTVAKVGNFAGEMNTPESIVAGEAGGGVLKGIGRGVKAGMEGKQLAREVAKMGEDALAPGGIGKATSAAKQALSTGQLGRDIAPVAGTMAGGAIGHALPIPGAGYGGAIIGNDVARYFTGQPKLKGLGELAGPIGSYTNLITSPALRYQLARMALSGPAGYTLGATAGKGSED